MADVQPENGFTKIADEILEQMARIKLSPTQYRILFIVWRYTYGFNRKEHELTLGFLSKATGCDKRQLQRELKGLEDRRIVFQRVTNGVGRKIQFNKNHDQWIGKTDNGETTIGEIDNGEIVYGSIGETVNPTIGETDNQDIHSFKNNIKDISTTTDEFESLERTHLKIFGGNIMSPIWMHYYQMIRTKGYKDGFIQELILEAAEASTGKISQRFVDSIFQRWHSEGITSREQAREARGLLLAAGGESYAKYKRNTRGHTEEDRIAAERDADLPNIVRPSFSKLSEVQRQRSDEYIRNT